MFAATLIVFREVFEIAIIICVILAATRQVTYRTTWMVTGVVTGLAAVSVVAYFAQPIVALAARLGEHPFHALILFTAAILISFSVIWMQQRGKQMATQARNLSRSINAGQVPLYSLATVIALAVFREGSEVVLFLYGTFTAGQSTITDILFGTVLGTSLGVMTGVVMYLGLIRIPMKQLFSVSAGLLALLAAGMAAKGAGHLVAANLLPSLLNPFWDTSALLSQHSLFGRFLSILVGYQDHPAGIQVLFYVATLVLIGAVLFMPTTKKLSS